MSPGSPELGDFWEAETRLACPSLVGVSVRLSAVCSAPEGAKFRTLFEIATPAELHVILDAFLYAFVWRHEFIWSAGLQRVFSDVFDVEASPALVAEARAVPLEFQPLRKIRCVELRRHGLCLQLVDAFAEYVDATPEFHANFARFTIQRPAMVMGQDAPDDWDTALRDLFSSSFHIKTGVPDSEVLAEVAVIGDGHTDAHIVHAWKYLRRFVVAEDMLEGELPWPLLARLLIAETAETKLRELAFTKSPIVRPLARVASQLIQAGYNQMRSEMVRLPLQFLEWLENEYPGLTRRHGDLRRLMSEITEYVRAHGTALDALDAVDAIDEQAHQAAETFIAANLEEKPVAENCCVCMEDKTFFVTLCRGEFGQHEVCEACSIATLARGRMRCRICRQNFVV